MHKNKTGIKLVLIILISMATQALAIAASADYIEAVRLDIDEFQTKVWQEQPNSSWLPSEEKASVDGSDSQESFNAFLKKRFPGSFILFKKLAPEDQKTVWKNYVNTGDLGGIRSDIYSLRRKSRR